MWKLFGKRARPQKRDAEIELFRSSPLSVQAAALVQSAVDNNIPRATNLIDNFGCDVNGVTNAGFTALHAAIVQGHQEMATLLLVRGADPNQREKDGSPVLFRAVGLARAWAVRLLIEKGADVNARGANEGTALHVAGAIGNEEIAKLLLELGADGNAFDAERNPPAVIALSRGHRALAAVLSPPDEQAWGWKVQVVTPPNVEKYFAAFVENSIVATSMVLEKDGVLGRRSEACARLSIAELKGMGVQPGEFKAIES